MSVARGFGLNGKSFYTNILKPMQVNLQFTVTPTNGLGVTSVKSNGYVENVFMFTSTTPTSGNGFLNPNPAPGFAVVQFKNNFNTYIGFQASCQTPTTGSTKIDNGVTLTLGQVYVITTLGNATAAQWATVGVPAGMTPALGTAFTAIATGAGSGNTATSRVSTPTTSAAALIEVVGNSNAGTTSSIATNAGQQVIIQFSTPLFTASALAAHSHSLLLKDAAVSDGSTTRVNAGTNLLGANTGSNISVAGGGANGGVQTASAGTPSGTMSWAVGAPATGSIVSASFYFDGSTVSIDGL